MMARRIKELFVLLGCLVALYITMQLFHTTCMIKYLTGISCPSCGMSRAVYALLQGDFHQAFNYHPLVFALPLGLLFYLFQDYFNEKIRKRVWGCVIGVVISVYIFRMFIPNSIVVFKPQSGVIFQFYQKIFTLFM